MLPKDSTSSSPAWWHAAVPFARMIAHCSDLSWLMPASYCGSTGGIRLVLFIASAHVANPYNGAQA
jgi:hypothetical protein